jgi:hypothetical protein
MMLDFDPERVTRNAQEATTEDLLDRITVYRDGMEPEAVGIIEAELQARGIGREEIEAHADRRGAHMIPLPDGTALSCSFCHRPAVEQRWGWHRMWSYFPVFPRYLSYCEVHLPPPQPTVSPDDRDSDEEEIIPSENDPHPPE